MRWNLLLVFFLLILSETSSAQWYQPCIDSTRIQPYYICLRPEYRPVCGCDGVTYRNDCEARMRAGVNTVTDGVCEDFNFDFYPNPPVTFINFSLVFRSYGTWIYRHI